MRIYRNFPEAYNELRRELKEMGIKIHTKSVQNLNIEGKEDMSTLEIQNYTYTVLSPNADEVPVKNIEWAEAEFADRISGDETLNPGETYKFRSETWTPLLNELGMFDYTYPQRLANTLVPAIRALKLDLYTRRAFVAVFDAELDSTDDFRTRIPCTLGYWFNYRQDKLNMTYLLRSSDFGEHYNYDVYLATRLLNYVASEIGVQPGTFTHWIGSFHVFAKDVEGVF